MTTHQTERELAKTAQLALLLEVASTPKPGNVDRQREYEDLRFEHFLAGAVGALDGLEIAANGGPVGEAFERAIAGMSNQSGGNTQFGAILLLSPLVVAASQDELTPATADTVVAATTVDDAVHFYRGFDHVDVAVDEPPADMTALDVRRGGAAEPTIRDQALTLQDIMDRSADRDGIAAEWCDGFPRTFRTAEEIMAGDGAVTDRAATAFLDELAEELDTFVVTQHDEETALDVREKADEARSGAMDVSALGDELVDRNINPGTTADIIAGALFVALQRGMEV
jgi:triphosphoribosyl-dephospho-CoA synthase